MSYEKIIFMILNKTFLGVLFRMFGKLLYNCYNYFLACYLCITVSIVYVYVITLARN